MNTAESIKHILTDQVAGYRGLIDLLRRERECLVHLNAAGVEALSKEKDTLVLKLRLLEEERIRLVQKFSEENGLSPHISLQQLSEATHDDDFRNVRLQMVSLLQGIAELNEFNRILIERSAGAVKNALNFLGSFGVTAGTRNAGSMLSREA